MYSRFQKMSSWGRMLLAALVAAVAAATGAYLALSNAEKARNERYQESANVTEFVHQTSKQGGPPPQVIITGKNQRTEQEINVVESWFKQVGFSREGERIYDLQYTDEQLQVLADNGDIIAIDTLLQRMGSKMLKDFEEKMLAFNAENDTEGMTAYLLALRQQGQQDQIKLAAQGIMFGSLNAITAMARLNTPVLAEGDSPSERETNKQHLLESLSYFELLRLRGAGELYAIHIDEDHRLNEFENVYGKRLTDEDRSYIKIRAKAIYDHYQSERYKLGVGDFDNSIPLEVKKFLGE